ncbi:MAG: hypothetical protein SA339_05360 [Methanomassiliicoccus sp.]|nr:hypothetical protein [Methanomassiliicoccus sp.]
MNIDRESNVAQILVSILSFGPRDYDTPEEANEGIDLLSRYAELSDDGGKSFANTPAKLNLFTDDGWIATIRKQKPRELIGIVKRKY